MCSGNDCKCLNDEDVDNQIETYSCPPNLETTISTYQNTPLDKQSMLQ